MKAFEDASNRDIKTAKAFREDFKHKKTSEAPVCPKCGMFMTEKVRHKSIKWICGGTLAGCYHSFVEETE